MLMSFQAILLQFLFFMSRPLFSKCLMTNSCFPQAGTNPFHRQLAKPSAPCAQSSTAGKVRPAEKRHQDQKVKGDSGRRMKGPLKGSDTTWCHVALSCRIVLGASFQVCFQLFMSVTSLLLETGRALYIFQLKQGGQLDIQILFQLTSKRITWTFKNDDDCSQAVLS